MGRVKPAKVLQFAKEVMGSNGKTDEEIITNSITQLEKFYKSLNLPITLKEANINANEVKKLAKEMFSENTVLGGYEKLKLKDIEKIIELAK